MTIATSATPNRNDPATRQRHVRGQHDEPEADHRHHRRRVDEIFDGERRDRFARREMMPRQQDLGGFAGEQPEWRDVADRIAGEKRRERARQRKRTCLAAGTIASIPRE